MKKAYMSIIILSLSLLTSSCAPDRLTEQAVTPATNTTHTSTQPHTVTPTPTGTALPTQTPTVTLTHMPTITKTPSPTPIAGGGNIAFWGLDDSKSNILYYINPETLDLIMVFDTRVLAPHKTIVWDNLLFHKWSPDGNFLSFSIYIDDINEARLYVVDVKANEVLHISSVESQYSIDAYWSQSGTEIFYDDFVNRKIFIHHVNENFIKTSINNPIESGHVIGYLHNGELFISTQESDQFIAINLHGEIIQESHFGRKMVEAWSNRRYSSAIFTNQYIYFSSCTDSNLIYKDCSIFKYHMESTKMTEIVSEVGSDISSFSVSPKEDLLAYRASPFINTEGWTGAGPVRVVDIKSGEILFEIGPSENPVNPDWSPDGNFLVYVSKKIENGYTQSSMLQLINRDGSESKEIVTNIEFLFLPTWSP